MRVFYPLRRLVVLCALILSQASCARSIEESGYPGRWSMRVGGRTFSVLEIAAAGGKYSATWTYPAKWAVAGGKGGRFSQLSNTLKTTAAQAVTVDGDKLTITMPNAESPTEPDVYSMKLTNPETAQVVAVDAGLEPWSFSRAPADAKPTIASDWVANGTYSLGEDAVMSHLELAELYRKDQEDRQAFTSMSEGQWRATGKRDAERRARVRTLLDAGEFKTGEDFRLAAFIFQHGERPSDYLLAHTLAVAAIAKGDGAATWIAAASLDRYLQSVKQLPIYGLGFDGTDPKHVVRERYERGLIPDSLRKALEIPTDADQEKQLRQLQAMVAAGQN